MLDSNNYKHRVILVGESKVGKTELLRSLRGIKFSKNYSPTVSADFSVFTREAIKFQLWDLPNHVDYEHEKKAYYENAFVIIYALDSSKSAEENLTIFNILQNEISFDHFQMIVFTKCDKVNVNSAQNYLNHFYFFNIPSVACSVKENKGITDIKDILVYYSRLYKKQKFLILSIERYSENLSKQSSHVSRRKYEALRAIVQVCRLNGLDQNKNLSIDQIAIIKESIIENKEIIAQHQHWVIFDWFFNLLYSSFLERRVTSNRLVHQLEAYLTEQMDSLIKSSRPKSF